MLAQFALIALAMFAVLSLVTDVGYVRLTQVQMQTAADAASLEGLRLRNIDLSDGFAADCQRRIAAREIVVRIFADDIDPGTGDTRVRSGAGPIVGFDDEGVGDLNARQTITHEFALYKPNLQLNGPQSVGEGNFEYGDMVSGRFDYSSPSTELSSYQRADFTPDSPPPPEGAYSSCPLELPMDNLPDPPTSGPMLDAVAHKAFLVRLRRTNDIDGLDNVPGASTGGPTLPLLFGRGSTIEAPQEGQSYSVRRDGIAARATSISNAQPVRRAGAPTGDVDSNPMNTFCQRNGLNGVMPFAIERAALATTSATLGPDPDDPSGPFVILSDGRAIGRFVVSPCSLLPPTAADLMGTIGRRLPDKVPPPACNPAGSSDVNQNHFKGYVPVYDSIGASGTKRIIGFARIDLFWPNCDVNPLAIDIETHAQILVAANASALITGLPLDLPSEDIPALMMANRNFAAPMPGALGLLAPALAR